MNRLTAISAAIGMAFVASSVAMAGDDNFAWISQTGVGNTANVDQTGADDANHLLRIGQPGGGILPGWLIDHNTVTQNGNGNTANVKQSGNGTSDITAQVYQRGNSNTAGIDSSGTNNWAYVSSYGNGNQGYILQNGGANWSAAYITQGWRSGAATNNSANISQTGTNGEYGNNQYVALPGGGGGSIWNDTNIAQDGNANIGSIYQSGNTNSSADIIQIGNGNSAYISQNSVTGGLASIEQYGNSNYGNSYALGDADSSIVQNGNLNYATTSQVGGFGNPNVARVTQLGNNNNGAITQNGGGNEAFFSRGRPGRGPALFFADRAHAPFRPVRSITSPPLLQFALASVLLVTASAISASDLEAWIDMEVQDGVLLATPKVRVQSTQTIRYELSAKRKGTAGASSTRQAGTQSVACCEPTTLATLRLSVGPADACTVSLIVKVDEKEVARVEEECKKP